MKTEEETKKKICPICNSDADVIPISYGLPIADEFLPPEVRQQERKSGGCIVSADSPRWYCKKDDLKF